MIMENQNQQTQNQEPQNQQSQPQPQQSGSVEGLEKIMETVTSILSLKFNELKTEVGDRFTHFADDLRDNLFKPTKEEIEEDKKAKRGAVF